ncbi:MAG: TetR/AcrR family transcriptional regulator [Blautia sp.]|nr:TetR/AcrR family transcriptional regulator [Blautia sp.]
MPRDKTTTHVRVLAAAREEFMEYGYEDASMRRIGERCGMTAAGLYRHCRDKAGLFGELVSPSIDRIDEWLEAHISRSIQSVETDTVDLWKDSEINMMQDLIYPNMEEYRLLLTKAQGSPYENFLHDLTQQHQERMLSFLPMLRERGYATREIDPKELHLLLSAYTSAMFEPVVHGYTEEEAYRCLDTLEAFFLPGWKQLLGF